MIDIFFLLAIIVLLSMFGGVILSAVGGVVVVTFGFIACILILYLLGAGAQKLLAFFEWFIESQLLCGSKNMKIIWVVIISFLCLASFSPCFLKMFHSNVLAYKDVDSHICDNGKTVTVNEWRQGYCYR